MRRLMALALLAAGCGGGSEEEDVAKDRAAAAANWAVTLKVDGADLRLPLKVMHILLFKHDEDARSHPSAFEIEGEGISLFGEIAPADDVGYGEKWEKLIGKTLKILSAGEFHRDRVESKLTLPGKPEAIISNGSMLVEKVTGKWSGSQGDKTLSGKITLTLQDGRTLQGSFAVNAVTLG